MENSYQCLYSHFTYCLTKLDFGPFDCKINIKKDVKIDNVYYCTDSKVGLSRINSEKCFNVFVDNRVKEMKGYQANFHGSNVKAKTIQVTY